MSWLVCICCWNYQLSDKVVNRKFKIKQGAILCCFTNCNGVRPRTVTNLLDDASVV